MSTCVIIPVYNGEKFITEVLDSVLAQTMPIEEIIVIDDGSTDATKQIIKSYTRVKYCYQINSGVSVARNRGIRESMSEFITFLDQDDLFLPHKMEVSLKYFKNEPQIDIVRGRFQYIFMDGFTQGRTYTEPVNPHCNFLVGSAVFRRKVLLEIGGFDETLAAAEDIDLWLRMEQANFVIKNIDDVCLYYRQHGNNTTMSPDFTTLNAKNTLQVLYRSILARRSKIKAN